MVADFRLRKLILMQLVMAQPKGCGYQFEISKYYIISNKYNKKARRMQASFVFLLTLDHKLHKL